ncbi:modulator of macroautophagy TMEM150B [Chanos chanos]|uniref:Modulator of macroautophagy TMEM150B n=1 Tax=Chanos chanos TaxID=29144 RepID=A0A6J2WZL7_CHACN|nr:modulator of macroautophagy TMEM150B [Chanos chanos]
MWMWAFLPVSLALVGTLGVWTVFGIAVSNQSVNLTVEFPYISTCGSYTPQSCLFSQICNVCSFLVLWVVCVRYQQVVDLGGASRVNTASLVFGFISSIGISILGNFQQSVERIAHLLGAFLAFFMGTLYFWMQAWITYKAEPSSDRRWTGPVRIVLCSVCSILVISMTVLHNIGFRSAAALCEWALVMGFFLLFAVFAAEFRHIDCHRLTVQKNTFNKNYGNSVFGLQPVA